MIRFYDIAVSKVKWLLNLLKKKPKNKVLLVYPQRLDWTDEDKHNLFQFMQGTTGKRLLAQLEFDLYMFQSKACIPNEHHAVEKLSIAHGKQLTLGFFYSLYQIKQEQKHFELSEEDADRILQSRINGNFDNNFEL